MEDDRHLLARLSRVNSVAQALTQDVKPWLASKNSTTSPSTYSVTSFNLVERFVYHFEAAQHLLVPFGHNQNMALPLTQLLRAVVYDIIVSYWLLFKGADFENRLKSLNGDFIKKNTGILRVMTNEASIQAMWSGWQHIAPDNFDSVSDNKLALASFTHVTFAEMCRQVLATCDYEHLRYLPNIYTLLSQQAHVSSFSKKIIYNKETGHYHMFDAIAHATLITCKFLLESFQDAQDTKTKIEEWLDLLYPQNH